MIRVTIDRFRDGRTWTQDVKDEAELEELAKNLESIHPGKIILHTEEDGDAPHGYAPIKGKHSPFIHLAPVGHSWLATRDALCGAPVTSMLAIDGMCRVSCRACRERARPLSA